ncbi:MAG: hypothetical protein PHX61_06710 [Alphaproteobacteria bacterium]|nr:hypothetical protein [Alphaproteobacteria bacterium]
MVQDAPSQESRARLSFDLDDEEFSAPPVVEQPKDVIEKKVEEISKKSGFTATVSPKKMVPAPVTIPPPASVQEISGETRKVRRRAKTGRTYPFNTKLKEETYNLICDLADQATEKEGRPVSLAEIIERSVDLLEKKIR